MVMDAREQSKGTAFKAKIITPYQPKFINETTVQFRDEMVVQIGAKKNNHSLHLWFSTLFRYQHEKWQMIFFHGSVPDAGSSSDDTFHVAEAEKQLKELERVVEQRTNELQIKNRELEIETSLEKVRAVAMGMHKPDDMLEVCKTMYHELKSLGFDELRNAMIHSFPEDNVFFINYDYSPSTKGLIAQIPCKGNASIEKFVKAIRKSANAFHHLVVKGKELKDWIAFRKANKEPNDPRLNKIDSLHYYNYSVGNSGIGISTYNPISKEKQDLLQRFRNVFQLAYQRYTDIAKAEAQTREAQIEMALERVRNQSMLMQHSQEIQNLSKIFHEQLLELQIPSEFSYIWLPDESNAEHIFWATWTEQTKNALSTESKSIVYPLDKKEKYTAACFKAWQSKTPVHIHKIPAKETVQFFDTWKELLKGASKLKARYFKDGLFYAESYMKYGCFGINIRRLLNEEEQHILFRFTIEFERAYTRFLDLQKAEAQTREAEIELSLERVRARTMSMHNSTDVGNTAVAMFDELVHLGVNKSVRCGIGILDETKFMEVWTASSDKKNDIALNIGKLDMTIHPMLTQVKKSWESKKSGFTYELKGKDLRNYFLAINKQKDYPVNIDMNALPERIFHNDFRFSEGVIYAFTPEPLTAEMSQIFKRFAGVFEQTYRRFLDLQKAEAQARSTD